jgi:hypothetical protein
MSGDLYATGEYPYVQFQPSEAGSVWHTDQEFTDSGGNSYLFRMYNAEYSESLSQWTTIGGGSDAYATVQNPDGSIHYYWNGGSSPWNEWQGSDNNTVYNAVDFGVTAGGSAADNTDALISLFTSMVTATAPALGGGTAQIPQYNFPVNASPDGITVPPGPSGSGLGLGGCIIQGLGTGGEDEGHTAVHFSITDPSDTGGPFTFLNCKGKHHHTSGGTYLRNIAFEWVSAGYPLDTVLYLEYYSGGADSCTFFNCATVANIRGLGMGFRNCTIDYHGDTMPSSPDFTAILLSAINCEISGPSEFNAKYLLEGVTTPTTATCISIGHHTSPSGCNLNKIRSLHITGWNYGIDYSDINVSGIGSNTQDNTIEGCEIDAINKCVNLLPASSTGQIFGQKFSNNNFTKSQNSTDGSAIVYIDTNGGSPSNVQGTDFIGNTIWSDVTGGEGQGGHGHHTGIAQNNQYGIQINVADSIRIIGGKIGQCGNAANLGADGSANICISGLASSILIDSVDLGPTYSRANSGGATGSMGSGASQYAILISATDFAGPMRVNNCDMSGFSGVPVLVSGSLGSGSPFIVTNCPGYNDQNTPINTLAHIGTGVAYSAATQGSHSGTNYYGPSFVMFTAASGTPVGTFQVNGGTPQALLAGQLVTVFLDSPYDTIQFNERVPAAFTWTGK